MTISQAKSYNAFGELASETDARGYVTSYGYNTMGRLTQKVMPSVSVMSTSGSSSNATPTEYYYYDLGGRLVGSRDANGNLTSRTLLAGSGYGGDAALVTAEFHADGGVFRTYYDSFTDAVILRNELGQDETRAYDNMGRLTTQTHRGGQLVDHYAYDMLGQRINHWNSLNGSGDAELWDYDAKGRIVYQRAIGGDTIATSYGWNASLATVGLGVYGGWSKTAGDLSPTTLKPKPPKNNKCGTFGQVLLVAIAVAVTIATSGAALAATGAVANVGLGIGAMVGAGAAAGTVSASALIAAGVVGGALGSIASQGVGVATGIQDKFSWKGVAMAALAGGIGGGVAGTAPGGG